MESEDARIRAAGIGLCASCRHRREQTSGRGSRFQRCARADDDPAYLRYPPLPVLRCRGHEPSDGSRVR